MRALIDAIDKVFKDHSELMGVTIKSFGPTWELPEDMPYINILPRSKERDREFIIGTDIWYNVNPEIEIHVWEASIENLRTAFEKCEALAEKVLDILADVSVTTLDVNHHESMIETYEDNFYETNFYYMAVIVLKANQDESYT